jgi:hypothetical protein
LQHFGSRLKYLTANIGRTIGRRTPRAGQGKAKRAEEAILLSLVVGSSDQQGLYWCFSTPRSIKVARKEYRKLFYIVLAGLILCAYSFVRRSARATHVKLKVETVH